MTTFDTDQSSNHTLYLQNLDDKIKKKELKHSLYCLFAQFGLVLEVVALKTMKMRGQAFIVFDEAHQAAAAYKAMQGFMFYDRGLKVSFAKTKSQAILIKEGKYLPLFNKKPENQLKRAGSDIEYESDEEEEPVAKMAKTESEPEKTLLLSNLPTDITQQQLSGLFQQYPGFQEVRMVPGKSDIALVEYQEPLQAKAARDALNGFKLNPTKVMTVEYSKQ